ncbi:MAG: hypothetical protein IJV15_08185 [Lachnospiraceae bacterium]|nr:hypothetical protein [Lachnospiraceae bacterium]
MRKNNMKIDEKYFNIEKIEYELLEIEQLINELQVYLNESIEGTLRVTHNHGSVQFYHNKKKGDTKGEYIRKKDENIAVRLAQQDYDRKFIQYLMNKRTMLKNLLDSIKEISDKKIDDMNIYNSLSVDRKMLVDSHIIDDITYKEAWIKDNYLGKGFTENDPEIITEKGERVRSKSEKLIADKLYMMDIPYRYECPITLRGIGKIYPDFTILKVESRKEVILEHFGMMDNPDYSDKAIKKINTFEKNGYNMGDNLLCTFETSKTPINMKNVEKMIMNCFK